MNAFDTYNNLMDIVIIIPFRRWRNWGLNSLNNLPEPATSVTEIQTQTVWLHFAYLAATMVITTTAGQSEMAATGI